MYEDGTYKRLLQDMNEGEDYSIIIMQVLRDGDDKYEVINENSFVVLIQQAYLE
jgi:hypothetical protein